MQPTVNGLVQFLHQPPRKNARTRISSTLTKLRETLALLKQQTRDVHRKKIASQFALLVRYAVLKTERTPNTSRKLTRAFWEIFLKRNILKLKLCVLIYVTKNQNVCRLSINQNTAIQLNFVQFLVKIKTQNI